MRAGRPRRTRPAVEQGFSPARRDAGLTLVQLIVAQVVLLSLALVLPAWVAVRVNHARVARAERDVRAIAEAIQRFEEDNGFPPAWTHTTDGEPGSGSDQVDLLVGPGEMPLVAEVTGVECFGGRSDSLSGQLIDNLPGYRSPAGERHSGWSGPYLSGQPRPDPWGNRYLVTVVKTKLRPEGPPGTARTTWVLSAGPDGVLETPCAAAHRGARPAGDDIGVSVKDPQLGASLSR